MENTTNMKKAAEEFRKVATEVLPHLQAVVEVMKKYYGAEKGASISVNTDGYINFRPYDEEWELTKYSSESGANASIRYEYREMLSFEESEGGSDV